MGRGIKISVSKPLKEKEHMGNLDVDGSIILKGIINKQGMQWIHLDHDRDLWPVIVLCYVVKDVRVL